MILFSSKVRQIIALGKAEAFFFLHILNGDGSLYRASTTFYNSFTAGNNVSYISDDFIVSVDPPQMTTTVDREQYKITVADPDFLNAIEAEYGMIGKLVEIRLGFVDPDTGLPLVSDMNDTLVVYRGQIDGPSAAIDTNELGDSSFVIACASPMISLDMSKGIFLSREYIRARDSNDGSCDAIYTGSGSLTYKWGRI